MESSDDEYDETNTNTDVEEEVIVEKPKGKAKGKEEKKSRKKKVIIPTTSAMWYKAKTKTPDLFSYTDDGDLFVPSTENVISLPWYRPSTEEERREKEEERETELKEVEELYDLAKKNLAKAFQSYREKGKVSKVIQFQQELTELDAKRTALKSPLRWTTLHKNPTVKEILFEDLFEENKTAAKKLGYNVFALKKRPFTFEESVKEEDEVPKEEEAEKSSFKEPEEEFTIIEEDSYLSPDYKVKFVLEGTEYNSAIQAFQGQRVTILGRPQTKQVLLKNPEPSFARAFGKRIVGQLDDEKTLEILTSIFKAIALKDPEVKNALMETEGTTLVYGDATDTKFGVGLDESDEMIMKKFNWRGENLVGKAWMKVRQILKTRTGGGVKEEREETKEERQEEVARRRKGFMIGLQMKKKVQFAAGGS